MLQSTFVTMVANVGDMDTLYTVCWDTDAKRYRVMSKYPVMGQRLELYGNPADYRWTRKGQYFNAAAAAMHNDGRRSKVSASTNPHSLMFVTNKRTGVKRELGSFRSFAEAACSLLNKSADTYRGQTYDDRLDTLVAITNQEAWTEA